MSFPLLWRYFTSIHLHRSLSNRELTSAAASRRELTEKWTSVSPINPWSDMRKNTAFCTVACCFPAAKMCLSQRSVATSEARQGATQHNMSEFGSAWRKHRFFYCCIIAAFTEALPGQIHYNTFVKNWNISYFIWVEELMEFILWQILTNLWHKESNKGLFQPVFIIWQLKEKIIYFIMPNTNVKKLFLPSAQASYKHSIETLLHKLMPNVPVILHFWNKLQHYKSVL
jgi:hypothetical protein